jgi:RNA polymerase sigma factor (sigma-70 family)
MTDEQAMAALKEGDMAYASTLFDRYHRKVYSYAYRMMEDGPAAEDITQLAFMRMIQYKHSYQHSGKFQSWIYRITHNLVIDHIKEKKKMKVTYTDTADTNLADGDLTYQVSVLEQEEKVRMALDKLTPDDRSLLVMTKYDKMKYEEVASILDTTAANVKVKVHRAIARLRAIYFQTEVL